MIFKFYSTIDRSFLSNRHKVQEMTVLKGKVGHVIQELISTEEVFSNDMTSIINGYGETIEQINCSSDLKKIFVVLNDLTTFSVIAKNAFLENRDNLIGLSNFFIDNKNNFSKYYSDYTMVYKNACDGLDAAMANEECSPHIKKCQKNLNHVLDLTSYLLKPIQRIMKYHLLLQSILSDKQLVEEDIESLKEAIKSMMSIAESINELRRTEEGFKRIMEICNSIVDRQVCYLIDALFTNF